MEREELWSALTEVFVDRFRLDPATITESATLFDELGLDSLDLVESVLVIEERFDIQIEDSELLESGVKTVGETVDFLLGKIAANA